MRNRANVTRQTIAPKLLSFKVSKMKKKIKNKTRKVYEDFSAKEWEMFFGPMKREDTKGAVRKK